MSVIQKWRESTTVRCTVPFRNRAQDESIVGKCCKMMEGSGVTVTKWGRDGNGKSKKLWLDKGLLRIWYTPTVKELQDVMIQIVDISEIRIGKDTKIFRNTDKTSKVSNNSSFFSIINRYGRSLNLSVPSKEEDTLLEALYSLIWTARIRYQCHIAQHFIVTAACCSSQYGLTAHGIELIVASLNHSYPVAKARNMVKEQHSSRLELTDFEIKLWEMLLCDPIKRLHSCLNPPPAPVQKTNPKTGQDISPVMRSTTVLLPKALVKFLVHFQHEDDATLQTANELISKYLLRSQNQNSPESLIHKDIINGMTGPEFQNMLTDVYSNSWVHPEKICDTLHLHEYFVSAVNLSLHLPERILLNRMLIHLKNGVRGIRVFGLSVDNLKKFSALCAVIREKMFYTSPYPLQIILGGGGGVSHLSSDYLRLIDEYFDEFIADPMKPWTLTSLFKKIVIFSELNPQDSDSPFSRIVHSYYTKEVVDPQTYFCLVNPTPRMLPGFAATQSDRENHLNNITNTSSRCITIADPPEFSLWGLGVSWVFMPPVESEGYCENHAVVRSFFEEVVIDTTSQPLVSGYCSKPEYLRRGIPQEVKHDHVLLIRIPAARFCWKLHPAEVYIECSIHDGLGGICRSRTTATDNLLTPFWKEVISLRIPNGDHSVLHLKVINSKNPSTPVAEAAALLSSIRLGYRSVPLKDTLTGYSLTHSFILMHLAVELRDDL